MEKTRLNEILEMSTRIKDLENQSVLKLMQADSVEGADSDIIIIAE